MEFKEMQLIWNDQNDERYVIDEGALYGMIKRRSAAVGRKLRLFELFMIATNLLVGIVLTADALRDSDQSVQFILPAVYLAYVVIALVRRLVRREGEKIFDRSMLGELDKAIWRVDYLIKQSRSMIAWYLLPLLLAFGFTMLYNGKPLWALVFIVILLPATYFGSRWEVNRFYRPKKVDLEALREQLTAPAANMEA